MSKTKKPATASVAPFSRHYLKKRTLELTTEGTRSSTEPLGSWAVRRIRLEGKPFRFEGHEYLRAIYDDTGRHIVLSKAAQIGGTTWAILRSIHSCQQGLNVLYLFPTKTDVVDFSKSRVAPLLADNPALSRELRDTDTAGLKKIGEAFLYLRGMQSTVGLKSIPVDLVAFDELDEATPEMKTMAKERLAHSDFKRIIELSNPSLPEYGIDESYQQSDQRHWMLKCPGCGHWTGLEREFPVKLGKEIPVLLPRSDGSWYRACVHCAGELDLDHGEWVAEHPDRPIHGYRISQLFSSKVDPGEIVREYRTSRFPSRFYNLKIGIPWADLERRLDMSSVLALCGDTPEHHPAEDMTYMGVDTGKLLHVVILRWNMYRDQGWLVHLAVCAEFAELDELLGRFEVSRCIVDGLPETHATPEFARRSFGRVYLCFFSETQRGGPKWNHDDRQILVNRTEALDMSRAAIRRKELVLRRQDPTVEEFARHMTCDAKVLEEDEETGAQRYRYIRTGENHWSMAFTYAWLAASKRNMLASWCRAMDTDLDD